jgi:hypothetical protein
MPVSASVDPFYWQNPEQLVSTPTGRKQPSPQRSLETGEIAGVIEDYRLAAQQASWTPRSCGGAPSVRRRCSAPSACSEPPDRPGVSVLGSGLPTLALLYWLIVSRRDAQQITAGVAD